MDSEFDAWARDYEKKELLKAQLKDVIDEIIEILYENDNIDNLTKALKKIGGQEGNHKMGR